MEKFQMQRITISIDDELLAVLDQMIAARGYQNRSEAMRDVARAGITRMQDDASPATHAGVAALVYVFDHEGRELAKRLTRSFHDHHDLSLATMHVHLDHESCMEVAVLRGEMHEIRAFAEHVIAERGVRHGRLVTVPAEFDTQTHAHGGGRGHRHLHTHVREVG
jgi:CopG family transcriptional regulator, nickel-responsive regulator